MPPLIFFVPPLIFFGNFLEMFGDLGIYWELFRDFVEFLRGVLVILGDLLRSIMILGSFLDFVGFSVYFEVFWEKFQEMPQNIFFEKSYTG